MFLLLSICCCVNSVDSFCGASLRGFFVCFSWCFVWFSAVWLFELCWTYVVFVWCIVVCSMFVGCCLLMIVMPWVLVLLDSVILLVVWIVVCSDVRTCLGLVMCSFYFVFLSLLSLLVGWIVWLDALLLSVCYGGLFLVINCFCDW